MREYRVFAWDDTAFYWLSRIGHELTLMRPTWGVRYQNCDADNMTSDLREEWEEFEDANIRPDAEVAIVFDLFCSRQAEDADFSPYVVAVVDNLFLNVGGLDESRRTNYGALVLSQRIHASNPDVFTIVATNESKADPAEMLAQAQGSVLMFLDKQDLMKDSRAVRRCVAGLIVAAVARQEAAEAERRMGEENAELRRGLRIRDEVAHGSYGLLEHVRHLVGMDESVLHVARIIEPFYQHKSGTYRSLPPALQRKFPAALMLEGEPGSGKTTLCLAIANSLGIVHHLSPVVISPGQHVGDWKKPLRDSLTEAFQRARDGNTVVIKADDIAWPDVSGIRDHGLRADWQDLMSFLRACIRLASTLNNHTTPAEDPLNIKNLKVFRGKVLWLFARNQDEMIGEMFAPLKDVLLTVPVVFPKDEASRRRILELYADKESVEFAEDAMVLALEATANYSGRALIGDDDMGRGFVFWAIAAVKDRETTRWQVDHGYRPDMTITLEVVQKWLAGSLHKEAASLNKALPEADPLPDRKRGTIAKEDAESDASWHAGVDLDQALALARKIWATQGACIENDPDTILRQRGAPFLRAVLALLKGTLQQRYGRTKWKKEFDKLFSFGYGKRKSMKLEQYLQNLSRRAEYKVYFPPRPGRKQFGAQDVDDDAAALEKEGIRLGLD